MKITVTEGQGIIKILHDGFADCLVIERLITLNWPDCHGSIGQYFLLSDYPANMRKAITNYIDEVLINGTDEVILDAIKIFLNIFENGVYDIGIYKLEHTSDFHSDTDTREKGVTSEWFYPENFSPYFYTIQHNEINEDRVLYYVDLIKNGKSPKAVICYNNRSHNNLDVSYILDGHHKIEAYRRLGKDISAVYIMKESLSQPGEITILTHNMLDLENFRDFFINNDYDIERVDFIRDKTMTEFLDDILMHHNKIPYEISKLFMKHNKSEDPEVKAWLNKRLINLSQNHYIEQGLKLSYAIPDHSSYSWRSLEINNEDDYQSWKNRIFSFDMI